MDLFFKKSSSSRQQLWLELVVESNYNASQLAQICGISLRQLENYFMEDFGRSPHNWLTEQRMIAARKLLGASDSIKEVAFTLKYKQLSHFCREFKKCYGITPTDFCLYTFPKTP